MANTKVDNLLLTASFAILSLFASAQKVQYPCNITQGSSIDTVEFLLSALNLQDDAIRISNSGRFTASFKIRLNSLFFYSEEEIVDAIIKMPNEYNQEPLERKAWRFVTNNITYNNAVTNYYWQRSPMVMLNSIGFDKCGNQAEMLARLWFKLGFKTKIWSLGGHLVPEVFSGNKWQMYDPSLQVFYAAKNDSICSVEELIENPALITSPVKPVSVKNNSTGIFVAAIRYSQFLADIYTSKKDNNESSPSSIQDTSAYKFSVSLPAGASFEFPIHAAEFAPVISVLANNYANARLTIPAKWKGEINIPLAICEIKGSGMVEVNERKFQIDSPELSAYLTSGQEFNYRLKFVGSHKNVEVIYLINAAMCQLKKHNNLKIFGSNVKGIKAEIFSPKTNFIPPSAKYDSVIIKQYKAYAVHRNELDSLLNKDKDITSLEDVANRMVIMNNYLKNSYNGAEVWNNASLLKKLALLKNDLPQGFALEKIYPVLEEPAFFVFFTSVLDTYSSKGVMSILMMNLKAKKKK